MKNLRLALRTLRRSPGFAAAAIVVLALGVGASTAVFSVLRSVVLRPLNLPRSDQLVRIYERPAGIDARWPFSGPDYLDLAKESSAFSSIAGIRAERQTLTGRGAPVHVRVARISSNFFSTLGVVPAIGTGPASDEDIAGGPRTAVLTDGFWRRELGGERAAIGRTLMLDGRAYTIGGILPADFHFPLLRQAEVLIPLALGGKEKDFRGMNWVTAVGRLRPGTGLRQAQSDLDAFSPRLHARIGEHEGWQLEARPLLDDLIGPVKPALTALFGAVLLALLIACVNVASLLLARGMARQRELAIRAALGGGRGDLVRHLLSEALLLALIGGALAALIAPWAVAALLRLAPTDLPRLEEIRVDGAVLAFALAAAIGAGLLAGIVPAMQMTRPQLMDVLKNGAGGTPGRARARSGLVVVETALAFLLAAGAGLMIRTLARLLDVPTGLSAPERVAVADLDLSPFRYPAERIPAFATALLERASSLPGVGRVALTSNVPLDPRGRAEFGFELEGAPSPPGQSPKAEMVWATPGYLETLGIPLLRGRDLTWADVKTSPHIVLVNEAFVRRFFPNGDPLGRRISEVLGPGNDPWTIAGVVGDVHTRGLDKAPSPLMVVPLMQYPIPTLRVAARAASGPPLQIIGALRSEVLALDRDLALSNPQPLSRIVLDSVGDRRFQMTLLSIFAALALTLAALGIYGLMAYAVAQRSREIGIRMALGADASRLLRMIVGGALRLSGLGIAVGAVAALAGTRVLGSLLYEVRAGDPATLLTTAAIMIASALLASWVPAWRATRVDPALPLRAE